MKLNKKLECNNYKKKVNKYKYMINAIYNLDIKLPQTSSHTFKINQSIIDIVKTLDHL